MISRRGYSCHGRVGRGIWIDRLFINGASSGLRMFMVFWGVWPVDMHMDRTWSVWQGLGLGKGTDNHILRYHPRNHTFQ